MKITKALQAIISDAKDNGYRITVGDTLRVYKLGNQHGYITKGLEFYEDGTAIRYESDADLEICTNIRTRREQREALGLGCES